MVNYHNQTFDDSDSLLRYGGDYWHEEYWNISTGVPGGKYHFSNAQNAIITFQFPVPAIAFYYYGLLRHDKNGGINRICVDCNTNTGGLEIDTNNFISDVDEINAQPILLYTERFQTPAVHTIVLWNTPDPSIPKPGSRISLDRFDLEVEDRPTATTFNTSSIPATPTTQPDKKSISISSLVGAIIGGNAALLLLGFGLWLWCQRKDRQRKPRPILDGISLDPISTAPEPFLGMWPRYSRVSKSEHESNQPFLDTSSDSWGVAPAYYPRLPGTPTSPPRYYPAGIYTKGSELDAQ